MAKWCAVLLLVASSLAARDLRPEVEVRGRVNEIGLSPAGSLWVLSAVGDAYRSEDGGRSWAEAAVPSRKIDPEKEVFPGDHLDRITFFDARRAMISGYIGKGTDEIFRTDDGGATWTKVTLPDGLWVYDAQATSDGHAWIVGSEGEVLRSDDYGRTWRALARPFGESERTLSVWFTSTDTGVVSSLFDGTVAVTNDGGATWTPFTAANRELVVKPCGQEQPDLRITKVRMNADRVIVAQCGGVFSAPLAEPRSWSRVTAGGSPVVDFELGENGGLIAATADSHVYEIARNLTLRTLGKPLANPPVDVAAAGKRIALIDGTLKIASHDGEAWVSSRMFGKGTATSWPIRFADRGAEDVLWGATEYFLYRSADAGRTWDRIAELPSMAEGLALQDDGNVLLWDRHGWVGRWDTAAGKFTDVPVLNGLDVVGSFRRRDLWLLFGGRQYQTGGRVEVAQTFFSGQFRGSVEYGWVAASADGGRSWRVIDKWADEGPQALFLSDDNRLTLVSWLCGIRQGAITLAPLKAGMTTVLSGDDREKTPYVQQTIVFDLLDPHNGYLLGWIHHIGNRLYRTRDGGRTWKEVDPGAYPRVTLHRLFDGTWLGLAPGRAIERWNGKRFERMMPVGEDLRSVTVDSRGSLLIRLKDDTFRVIEPGAKEMRVLRVTKSIEINSAASCEPACSSASRSSLSRRISTPSPATIPRSRRRSRGRRSS